MQYIVFALSENLICRKNHLFFKRRAKKTALRLYTCNIYIEHAVSTCTYLCWLRGHGHKALGTEIPPSCGAEVSGSHFGRRWLKISFNFLTVKTSNQPQMSASLQENDIFCLSQNNFHGAEEHCGKKKIMREWLKKICVKEFTCAGLRPEELVGLNIGWSAEVQHHLLRDISQHPETVSVIHLCMETVIIIQNITE